MGIDSTVASRLYEAVQLLEVLQAEQEETLQDSSQLKTWYLELLDAFTILKQQHSCLKQERDDVEQQYQHLCDGWRQELEQKQAAFDSARSSILSQRDVEVLRARITADVERPLKSQCEALRKEIHRLQGQLSDLKNERECKKLDAEAKILHLEVEIKRLESEASAATTHRDIKHTQDHTDNVKSREAELLAQIDTLSSQLVNLTTEVHSLRSENLHKSLEHQNAIKELELEVSQAQASEMNVKHELQVARNKLNLLESEMIGLSQRNYRLLDKCKLAQSDLLQNKHNSRAIHHRLLAESEAVEKRIITAMSGCAQHLEKLTHVEDENKMIREEIENLINHVDEIEIPSEELNTVRRTVHLIALESLLAGTVLCRLEPGAEARASGQVIHKPCSMAPAAVPAAAPQCTELTHCGLQPGFLLSRTAGGPAIGQDQCAHWMAATLKAVVLAHQIHSTLQDVESENQRMPSYPELSDVANNPKAQDVLCDSSQALIHSRNHRWALIKRQLQSIQERQSSYLPVSGPV